MSVLSFNRDSLPSESRAVMRKNFTIDLVSAAFVGLYTGMVSPFIGILAVKIGASDFQLALVVAAPLIGQLFGGYWGQKCEGKNKVPYVVVPGTLARLLILPLGFVVHPWLFVALILASNLMTSISLPAYTALIQKIYAVELRGQLTGYVRFSMGLLQAASAWGAGWLADRYGFGSVFVFGATMGLVAMGIFTLMKEPPEPEPDPSKPRQPLSSVWKEAFADKRFFWFITGVMLFGISNLILLPGFPKYQINVLGLSNTQVASLTIAWTVAWFATQPIWGYLIDKHKPIYVLIGSCIMYVFVPLLYYYPGTYGSVILASAISGISAAAYDLGWMNDLMQNYGSKTSTYSGLFLSMLGVRGIIAPLMGSAIIAEFGLDNLFLISVFAILLSIIPLLKVPAMLPSPRGGYTTQVKSRTHRA